MLSAVNLRLEKQMPRCIRSMNTYKNIYNSLKAIYNCMFPKRNPQIKPGPHMHDEIFLIT